MRTWRPRGFTLLEILAALTIFICLLAMSAFCVHRLSQDRRAAQGRREIRQEAEASFAQITQDLEAMPIRRDLEYGFGRKILYPGDLEVACAFLTEQTAPPSLNARATATGPQRGFSIAAYRLGADAQGNWAGLQRGLAGLTLNDYFMGLHKPADVNWPAAISGADPLPALPGFSNEDSPLHWAPARLEAWPLEQRNFAPLSPDIVGFALAYQLRRDATLANGVNFPAGAIVAVPPGHERPPKSGDWFPAVDELGAIVVGLAFLPESARQRLTLVELIGVRDALVYDPIANGGPTMAETPVEYWERRAGPNADTPLPQIPDWVRREIRFQQRRIQVGAAGEN